MKKFYSFLIATIIATVAAFQANALTMKMNVTGADLLNFEWLIGTGYTPTITEGENTIVSTDFGDDSTWLSFNIIPKKENVKLTVTYTGAYVGINDTGINGKHVYAGSGDCELTVVAEEYELVEYPVHFEFPNEGTEDYLKEVFVNGEIVENFMAEDFKVMAGSTLYFTFDTNKYGRDYDADENWCYRNGEAWNSPATGGWTSNQEKVTNETTYSFRVKPNPVFDVTFKINNPGSAELSIDYGVYETLNEAENIKKVYKKGESDVQMTLKAMGDYGIKSVKRIVEGQDPVTETESYGSYYLYFKEEYGNNCTYEIETTSKEDLRTATCVVNIDDNADNIRIIRDYVDIPDLVNGDNTIKFNPNSTYESRLTIATRDYTPLYKVLVDGVKQTSYSASSYSIDITDGCRVEVKTVMPDTPAKISFDFVNEGTEDFIKSIQVNYEDINLSDVDFDNGLEVERGQYVYVQFNTEKYNLNAFYVDGAQQLYNYYNWSGTVFDDTALKFDVTPHPTTNVTINIDNPQFVCVRKNATYGDIIPLVAGENQYTYTGSVTPSLYIMPFNGGEITSVKADGFDLRFDEQNKCYEALLGDGMVIDIVANGPERDKTAMFWTDANVGTDSDLYSLYLSSANSDLGYEYKPIDISYNYTGGYQQFEFLDAENPFRIGYYYFVSSAEPKVYLNNEEVISEGNGWVFNVANNDVVKFFLYEAPAECNISFDVPDEIADVIHVTSDRIRNEATYTSGVKVLTGAEITITSSEEAVLKGITVDGATIDPNEDGSYTFVASANHEVTINAESGIISIGSDNAPAKVYNLQGIRVSSDLDNLPAGFYIVNGAKVYVK